MTAKRPRSRTIGRPFADSAVADVFAGCPPRVRARLMTVRELIFTVAAETAGVGEIEEALRWGEPAYLAVRPKSGSTIRINRHEDPSRYALYFNCQTTLVETFRTMFPDEFIFEGNRALVLDVDDEVPIDSLSLCIAAALTYHLKR